MTGRTFTVALPAGMRMLSLNGRYHWATRNAISRDLKHAAFVMARNAKIPPLERVSITVEYQPPDRRRRDNDNIPPASGKPAIDGIVQAHVLVDDSREYVTEVRNQVGERFPKGRLVLHIREEVPGAQA